MKNSSNIKGKNHEAKQKKSTIKIINRKISKSLAKNSNNNHKRITIIQDA